MRGWRGRPWGRRTSLISSEEVGKVVPRPLLLLDPVMTRRSPYTNTLCLHLGVCLTWLCGVGAVYVAVTAEVGELQTVLRDMKRSYEGPSLHSLPPPGPRVARKRLIVVRASCGVIDLRRCVHRKAQVLQVDGGVGERPGGDCGAGTPASRCRGEIRGIG
jgi:hypothetical protein